MRFPPPGELSIADRELYEGDDESRRRAREEMLRGVRLNFARTHKTWVELESGNIEPAPLRHVVDTSTGLLYRPVRLATVFPSGAPQLVNEGAASAFYVVDQELYFLRKPASGPQTLAELEERRARPKPEPQPRRRTT